VTGASGFVGSAVVKELREHGHSVLALARSDVSADAPKKVGAEVVRGATQDLDVLQRSARETGGVIHCAFNHDFSKYAANCEDDRRAIEAMGAALEGRDKPLIITSGTGVLQGRGLAMEEMPVPADHAQPRVASEQAAEAAAKRGVRVSSIRLPQVHGEGDHAFTPMLINLAREKGRAAYVDEGKSVWPAIHRFDLARLYRSAIENNLGHPRYHAVAEEGIAQRDIAAIIGKRLGLPIVSLKPEEVADYYGWLAPFAMMNNPTSSALTRQWLHWQPQEIGLLEGLDYDY
jgi:nucleoside-diphosphate-sugar epimerase